MDARCPLCLGVCSSNVCTVILTTPVFPAALHLNLFRVPPHTCVMKRLFIFTRVLTKHTHIKINHEA